MVALVKKYLATAGGDRIIKIWNFDMTEEFKKSLIEKGNLSLKLNINTLFVEKLEGHTDNVTSLAYNKEKNILVSGSEDNTIRLWNMQTFQVISVILNVRCDESRNLSLIDRNRIIIGGNYKMVILDISSGKRGEIKYYRFNNSIRFIRMNEKILLIGCSSAFCFLNIEDYSFSMKLFGIRYQSQLYDLVAVSQHEFWTTSTIGEIKVWKY